MKKPNLFFTIVAFLSLYPGLASAIDRPLPEVDAPASPSNSLTGNAPTASLSPIPSRLSEVWIGIVPGKVPDVLLAQLEMNANPGVVVEGTAPESPARKAGIMDMDIVLRVADRPIFNPEDLKSAIEGYKPGDKVNVELLRGGKKKTVTVELDKAKRSIARRNNGNVHNMIDQAIGAGATPLPMGDSSSSHDPLALLQGLMSGMDQGNDASDPSAAIANMRRMMRLHLQQGAGGIRGMRSNGGIQSMNRSTFRFSDGDGEISILGNGNETKIVAYDRNGKLQFEGPYSTDEDKKNVPPEIRARLERVNMWR